MISIFRKIYTLLKGEDPRVLYVSKDEIAKDLKEQFHDNTELLKVFEKQLNKNSNKHAYISLI